MAPYEALYGRKCRTPLRQWDVGVRRLLGPDLVQQTTEKIDQIRERIKSTQSRQKSYADKRRKPLEFCEDDHVFHKVTPIIGDGRALRAKKLNPRFIGPFQIIARIGTVVYRLALPQSLSNLHDVFHVSQLRKYIPYPNQPLNFETVDLCSDLPSDPIHFRFLIVM